MRTVLPCNCSYELLTVSVIFKVVQLDVINGPLTHESAPGS